MTRWASSVGTATLFDVTSRPRDAMSIEDVSDAASRFRRAIELTRPHPVSFGDFPRGACGAVCELLGDYLRDTGLGSWNYVMGVRSTENGGTHAWLELEGALVDITGDQFDDAYPKVILGEAPAVGESHLGFDRASAGRPAGLAHWSGATHDEDAHYYARVRRVADELRRAPRSISSKQKRRNEPISGRAGQVPAQALRAVMAVFVNGAVHRLRNLVSDLVDLVLVSAQGALVREGRAVTTHLLGADVVPDRKHRLLTSDGLGYEPVELVVCPALGEERWREHHDAKAARSDAFVDLPPQAVADLDARSCRARR